ncbi:hypothetical protein T265_02713 [Opisthorchis viverrini]|uniref:Uncharacterized protein n=1 Tax=Opisthorchis viverrini TaxID=6198 RepID=A0A074ZTU3_OPIVI|nr:hypothetical protein T265_02713 [Opisthorchis viverrini]KER30898.1 hypothetical protein T265_02713 [Opisthorchis viverrini]
MDKKREHYKESVYENSVFDYHHCLRSSVWDWREHQTSNTPDGFGKRLGQPGSIPDLVLTSSGMAVRHQEGATVSLDMPNLAENPAKYQYKPHTTVEKEARQNWNERLNRKLSTYVAYETRIQDPSSVTHFKSLDTNPGFSHFTLLMPGYHDAIARATTYGVEVVLSSRIE